MFWSLASCNKVVSFVAKNGIFVRRMTSPLGRNTQWCCDTVGLSLFNIHSISNDFVLRYVCGSLHLVLTSVNTVHELLQVRWNRLSLQLFAWVGLYRWSCVHWLGIISLFHCNFFISLFIYTCMCTSCTIFVIDNKVSRIIISVKKKKKNGGCAEYYISLLISLGYRQPLCYDTANKQINESGMSSFFLSLINMTIVCHARLGEE